MPRRYAPRNDMLKENRFCGCKNVVRNGMQRLAGCRRLQEPFLAAPWHHLLASATTHLSSACHCEPVRTLVWQSASPQKCLANRLMFGRIRKSATDLPKVVPTCQVSLRGRGLPHQCAHWFAMTCKRRVRVSECKAVGREGKCVDGGSFAWYNVLANADTQQISACHCEERSDVAIRSPCSTTSQKAVL